MTSPADRRHVLIVDDEHDVADTQAFRLAEDYETTVAYGGAAALEEVDDTVDAVLLDRRMPDIHGDEVLERLRERGYDGVVVMLTAVDPDLNILEMAFDDYLQKPVDRATLLATLDQHLDRPVVDDRLEEYFKIVSKLQVIEAQTPSDRLAESSEYAALKEREAELADRLADEMDAFETVVETHRALERNG